VLGGGGGHATEGDGCGGNNGNGRVAELTHGMRTFQIRQWWEGDLLQNAGVDQVVVGREDDDTQNGGDGTDPGQVVHVLDPSGEIVTVVLLTEGILAGDRCAGIPLIADGSEATGGQCRECRGEISVGVGVLLGGGDGGGTHG